MQLSFATKWISSLVMGMAVLFSVYLFFDSRYVQCVAAEQREVILVQSVMEQMKSQQLMMNQSMRMMDQRQLDQLRISRSLLETEMKRSPGDRLLQRDLETINRQIKELEERLRNG